MPVNLRNVISPYEEMISYEMLWGLEKATQKTISSMFKEYKNLLPSEVIRRKNDLFVSEVRDRVEKTIKKKLGFFSVSIHNCFQYPENLRQAKYPIELFYYKGKLDLVNTPCISVVGARNCTEEGKKRTRNLVDGLVENGFTIVSGLARGIDTEAHTQTLKTNGFTIGVLGTPIDRYYPKENKVLQDKIATEHLLISQVPFYRHQIEHLNFNKLFFPQRNETMAALSAGTIIVEASDTSGSLTQARACFQQGRFLFILNSCFNKQGINWPHTYEKRGAIRVKKIDDILDAIEKKRGEKKERSIDAVEENRCS